jgi:hypothetical protein
MGRSVVDRPALRRFHPISLRPVPTERCVPSALKLANTTQFSDTLLAQSNFHGPISLQQEYAIPGVADHQGIALSRATVPEVMSAVKENLDYLKSVLREAYEEA